MKTYEKKLQSFKELHDKFHSLEKQAEKTKSWMEDMVMSMIKLYNLYDERVKDLKLKTSLVDELINSELIPKHETIKSFNLFR